MIHKPIIEPLRLTDNAFSDETESVGDGLTLVVASRNTNIDPIQVEFGERVLDERRDGATHNPPSRVRLGEPVARVGNPIALVDGVVADDPDKRTLEINPTHTARSFLRTLHRSLNEFSGVLDAGRCIKPRKPLPEMRAIQINQLEQRLRIGFR